MCYDRTRGAELRIFTTRLRAAWTPGLFVVAGSGAETLTRWTGPKTPQ